MNPFVKITLVSAICLLGTLPSIAQSTKFGHINSAELLASMPEIKVADKTLQDFNASLEAQLKTMTTEYQTKVQAYQGQQAAMADPIKEAKVKEITDLEARIQEFQQTAQESAAKKKEELYSPILKRAEAAIVEVAKENTYAYIFVTSAGAVVYAQPSDNVMDIVKKKLAAMPVAAPVMPAPAVKPMMPKK
jgi:outer membrane protein